MATPAMHRCRPATTADIPAICKLEQDLNRAHHEAAPTIFKAPEDMVGNHEFWQACMSKPGSLFLVAELDGDVIGFINAEIVDETHPLAQPIRSARIGAVCVAESLRGRGIGRSLVDAAERWSVEQGAAEMRLTVWKVNSPAVRLYERHGFATRSLTMSKPLVGSMS